MLTTSQNSGISFDVIDSTVVLSGGAVQVGNTVLPYQGGRISFKDMSDLTTDGAGKYQHSLLYAMCPISSSLDMTTVRSTKGVLGLLPYPSLPDSTTRPIGLFTFYSPDSTEIKLINQYKV